MSLIAMAGGATGTGTVTLLAPITNTDRTLTLPDATGTVLSTATAGVPVNGPAFSANAASGVTVTTATWTKATLDTEEFDTNSNFASSRFTPTVAGYYQLNGSILFTAATSLTRTIINIYKNGVSYKQGVYFYVANTNATQANVVSSLVYANGTTDYFELYGFAEGVGTLTQGATATYLNGAMIRSAV